MVERGFRGEGAGALIRAIIVSLISSINYLFIFLAEAELQRQLSTMPIRNDTLRVRSKREALERKLGEVDEAMKIFSRPKVFVKLDS